MLIRGNHTKVLPREISCFRLNSDGTYENCDADKCSVYIDDTQVAALWNPTTSKFIRETYGPVVGVMHFTHERLEMPIYNTTKFVLGG